MAAIELHSYFRSSAAFRTRIALKLKGLDHDIEAVNLAQREHRGERFLALNPQGFVPTLIDGANVLIQSLAIIEYLDERYPEPPLLPEDPLDRAYVRAVAQLIACDMHPLNNARVQRYLQEPLGAGEEARQRWYEHWIAAGFESLESLMAASGRVGRFCHGNAPSLADVCLVPQVFNAKRYHCPLEEYPTIMRVFEACMALPAFIEAQPEKQADAAPN